jgi:hypothetical protein
MVADERNAKTRLPPWDLLIVAAHELAQAEGWWLSRTVNGLVKIQKLDQYPAARFADDEEARQHVIKCAEAGSILHHDALLKHGTYWFRDHRNPEALATRPASSPHLSNCSTAAPPFK